MRLLVTGGAGFIGSAVVRHFVAQGHQVATVDKLTYAANMANLDPVADAPNHSFHRVDICDRAALNAVVTGFAPDAIMHLAAESHVDRSIENPLAFIDTNVVGTVNLLQVALADWETRGRPEGFRFHHISTDEVYGDLDFDDSRFTETTPYAPSSPYSASKASSDFMVAAWHRTFGLPVVISNCSNNYGPYQHPEKLIPHMILNALAGRPLPVYGTGRNVRDWLHVEDHVSALERVLTRGRLGERYNIGGDAEWANIDVVRLICKLLDARRPRADGASYVDQIAFVTDRKGHDLRYAIDPAKVRAELDWRPSHDFQSGLAATVDWYLANPAWWGGPA